MSRADVSPLMPLGRKPPWWMTLLSPGAGAFVSPRIMSTPTTRKTTTAATLMRENQNSNSPNRSTPNRLMPVRATRKISDMSQVGATGHMAYNTEAAAVASAATTTTSWIHQTHPTAKPTAGPIARSA